MYSIIVSVIINFIAGIFLYYEIGWIIFTFSPWNFPLSYHMKCIPVLIICGLYNCRRYQKKVIGKKYRKKTFHLTLWLPLFAYILYVFGYVIVRKQY